MDLLNLLFLAYILPHAFILAEDRFHLALIPFFAVLAAHAVTLIKDKAYKQMINTKSLIFAVTLIFLLTLNWGLELHRDADKISTILGPNGNRFHFPY